MSWQDTEKSVLYKYLEKTQKGGGNKLDSQVLKSYIVRYDKNQKNLADAMELSLSRLNAKINETGAEFNQSEIKFIKKRYRLTDKETQNIFFNN